MELEDFPIRLSESSIHGSSNVSSASSVSSTASNSFDATDISSELENLCGVRKPSRSEQLRKRARSIARRTSEYSQSLAPDSKFFFFWALPRFAASCVQYCLVTVLPRFLRRGGLQRAKPLSPTSYLDALRGVAALVVYNYHNNTYTGNSADTGARFMKLPFVSLWYSGRSMVAIFFVISGYVLSMRMIKFMQTSQSELLLHTLASAIFRRYIRLYLSTIIASFISFLLSRWFNLHDKNFFIQLWDWMKDIGHFSNPFADIRGYWSDNVFKIENLVVSWTIPVEFRGSMFLYLFCIGSCRLSTQNRILLCIMLILFCYYWVVTYAALFLAGALIAELSFIRYPERLHPSMASPPPQDQRDLESAPLSRLRQPIYERVFFSLMFLVALLIISKPDGNFKDLFWPWPYLEKYVPKSYWVTDFCKGDFFISMGGIVVIVVLEFYPALQTPLKWNFLRYLGDLSFGIYLMHPLLMWTLWDRGLNPARVYLLGEGKWTFAPIMIVNYIALLWVADLFSRLDQKVVDLARWLESKLFI